MYATTRTQQQPSLFAYLSIHLRSTLFISSIQHALTLRNNSYDDTASSRILRRRSPHRRGSHSTEASGSRGPRPAGPRRRIEDHPRSRDGRVSCPDLARGAGEGNRRRWPATPRDRRRGGAGGGGLAAGCFQPGDGRDQLGLPLSRRYGAWPLRRGVQGRL